MRLPPPEPAPEATGGAPTGGTPRGGAIRLFARVATALALLAAAVGPARADEAEDLRGELLAGGPGRWRAVFRKIEANPALLGRTLGPIFRDRSERVGPLSAWAAAALGDRAGERGEEPLLADEILLRMMGDEAYVADVRANLDVDGLGWTSLVATARDRLLDREADPADRSAAAFFLRFEPTTQNARDLVEAWETAPRQVADAAAESLERLLVTRFESPARARAFFDARATLPFVDWVREASAAKDRPDWPVRVRMVEEARKNLERASIPAELQPYLSVETTPYVEVRRAAARRAARVDATAEAWLPLLVEVVSREDDRETLMGLLEVAKRVRVDDREKAQALAKAILERLAEYRGRGPLAVGLVNLLASVADEASARAAFEVLEPDADAEMLDALLTLAGSVGGTETLLATFHATRAGQTDPGTVRLRVKSLEAMAQSAKASAEPAVAERYLRAVLRLDDSVPDEAGLPKETSADGRRAAVLALQAFRGAATGKRLADVARTEAAASAAGRPDDAAIARLAVGVLAKLASGGDPDAAVALVDLARDPTLDDTREDALKALARLPAESAADTLDAARDSIRVALSRDAQRDVRLAAAEAAEALGAAAALPGVVALALDTAQETPGAIGAVRAPLEGLVRRLVRAGSGSDRAVAFAVELLAAAKAFEAASAVGNAAAEEGHGRLALQVARARVHQMRARDGVSPEERVRAHQEAERILRTATTAAPPDDRGGETWSVALSLRRSLLDALLADEARLTPEERKRAYLARVEVAAARLDPADVATATDLARRARSLDLTPEEAAALDRDLEAIGRGGPQ